MENSVNGFGEYKIANAEIKIEDIHVKSLTRDEARIVLNGNALRLYNKLQSQGGTVIFGKGSVK